MLVKFTVESWKSFRGPATLSMAATEEKRHSERLTEIDRSDLVLLPVAAIYGGNASGKSNLFSAMQFFRDLIVKGRGIDQSIKASGFALSEQKTIQPTKFLYEFVVNRDLETDREGDFIYEYSIAITGGVISEEKLTKINPARNSVLFWRKAVHNKSDKYSGKLFRESSHKNKSKKAEWVQRLESTSKGTRSNQPFLTNLIDQNITVCLPVYDWFRKNLHFIDPYGFFKGFRNIFKGDKQLLKEMNALMFEFDAGIDGLEIAKKKTYVSPKTKQLFREGKSLPLRLKPAIITRPGDEFFEREVKLLHDNGTDYVFEFEFEDESDGTKRLLNILAAFLELLRNNSGQVYVFDELDRSMHSNLTRKLLEFYLIVRKQNERSQLIFTTQDTITMNLNVFRRDEIWFTKRILGSSTEIFSLCQFKENKMREKDENLREIYLLGQLGGVPNIQSLDDTYNHIKSN